MILVEARRKETVRTYSGEARVGCPAESGQNNTGNGGEREFESP